MDTHLNATSELIAKPSNSLVKKIYSYFKMALQNYRTRRHLSELPDHLLIDIGVSRAEAQREARKSFW